MTNEPSVATTNRVKLATSATVNDGVHCSPAGQTSIPPLRNLGALSLINRLSNLRASAFGSDQEKESQKTGVCVCVCVPFQVIHICQAANTSIIQRAI